jgi:hypothetical protein
VVNREIKKNPLTTFYQGLLEIPLQYITTSLALGLYPDQVSPGVVQRVLPIRTTLTWLGLHIVVWFQVLANY